MEWLSCFYKIHPVEFQQQLLTFFEKTPSEDQVNLFLNLEGLLRKRDRNAALIIRGYAGTGKTTAMAAFVKTLKHYKVNTQLLAPTGRAAKVLSLKAEKDAFTIHKVIYRKKKKTDLVGGLNLAFNTFKNAVFIVDEASMIGDFTMNNDGNINQRNLLEDLIEYVFSQPGNKLVFVGDNGQLPPVGAEFSPALNLEYMESNFFNIDFSAVTLSKVHRQKKESGVLYNATKLRSTDWEDYPTFELKAFDDILRVDGTDLQDYLESSYDNFGVDETIVITRSNKNANNYNQHIRGRVFWYEEQINSGDLLMVVKNNYYWLGEENKIGFIANGEVVRVKRILKEVELYGFQFQHLMVELVDYPAIDAFEVIVHTESLTAESPALSRERMKELFYEVEKDYSHVHYKKERYEKIMADPYFNALQVKFAYAVTCHKSQGGQWAHVYIDQGFLNDEMLNSSYYRWLYTAITRATEKVFLVNFKDEFFLES